MLIGVVSDNHGLIDPALPSVLDGVEEIWHAGDFVTPELLPFLERIVPVVAVRGNNDSVPVLRKLPEEQLIERGGHRILLRHIVGRPPRIESEAKQSVRRHKAAIVVMGHSHKPDATLHEGILYLNPGSCGPRRFSLPRAAARLELKATRATFTVVDLDTMAETVQHFDLAKEG